MLLQSDKCDEVILFIIALRRLETVRMNDSDGIRIRSSPTEGSIFWMFLTLKSAVFEDEFLAYFEQKLSPDYAG